MNDDFRDYVSTRLEGWRRTAYLLCGDWHTADDVVSAALMRVYRHWRRVSTMDNPDAYVRQALVRTWLNERRRPWRREMLAGATMPDPPSSRAGPEASVTDRMTVLALLAELPAKRRAVLVLRYFCDLSVEDTAVALGCSTGNVKSQTARALGALRARLAPTLSVEGDQG
ncbi:SigE family RNA polymerase sigma factor [Actinomycetes bacterium KLBMP 9797]